MIEALKFLVELVLKIADVRRYKADPSDIQLLGKMWMYLNYETISRLCDHIPYGYLDREQIGFLFDDYLNYRKNPEHQFYDKQLEQLLHAFDEALEALSYDATGLFKPDFSGILRLEYDIDPNWESYTPKLEERARYQNCQRRYQEMVARAQEVSRTHSGFIQALKQKRLLHQVALTHEDEQERLAKEES